MTELQNAAAMLAGAWPGLRMHQPLRPPALGVWSIPRTVDEVAGARHHIRKLTARVIGYGSLTGDVELMAGELLANAVEHGGGERVWVRVTADRQTVRVEVRDCGSRPLQEPHEAAPMSERGRGLLIVAAFATTWDIHHDVTGTTAWFELAVR